MDIIKVEFLNDLDEVMNQLQSHLTDNDKILRLAFYTRGKIDDQFLHMASFKTLAEALEYFKQNNYADYNEIDFVIKNLNNDVKTIHMDKAKSLMVILDSSKKQEEPEIISNVETPDFEREEGCTYYKFEFGQIGKYDANKGNYYLYNNGNWEIDGSVERWVIDPGYSYEIIGEKHDLHR